MKNITLLLLLLWHTSIFAEIIEIQALDFGTIVVINNSSPQTFRVTHTGVMSKTGGIGFSNDATPALFSVTELNPFSRQTVEVVTLGAQMTPSVISDETFTLTITDHDSVVIADGDGNGLIRVGGSITTSGNGSLNFENASYKSQFNITINF